MFANAAAVLFACNLASVVGVAPRGALRMSSIAPVLSSSASPARSSDYGHCPVPRPLRPASALSARRQRLVYRLQAARTTPRAVYVRPDGESDSPWRAVGLVSSADGLPMSMLRAAQVQAPLIAEAAVGAQPELGGKPLQLGLLYKAAGGHGVVMPVPQPLRTKRAAAAARAAERAEAEGAAAAAEAVARAVGFVAGLDQAPSDADASR